MQSEDKISTQLPPPIEELDQAIGATQLTYNEKSAPPPPWCPRRCTCHPWFRSLTLWTSWCWRSLQMLLFLIESTLPKHAGHYELFFPELKPGMADHLKPNTYWAVGQDLDDVNIKSIKTSWNQKRLLSTAELKESVGTSY